MKQAIQFSLSVLIWILCLANKAGAQIGPITIAGPDSICAQNSGNYSITTIAGIHYVWSVTPEGNIVGVNNLPNVVVQWGMPGTGTLYVNGYDSLGVLKDTGSMQVVIMPAPEPFITANVRVGCQSFTDSNMDGRPQNIIDDAHGCVKVCESSIVTYTANSLPGDRFGWNIVGGTILAMGGDTCQVQWGFAGSGNVTVYDTTAFGCTGMKSVCIDILNKPHALFSLLPPSSAVACLDQTLIFVDHSVDSGGSPIVNWFWDFRDGGTFSTSSSTTLTHEYTVAGTYWAKLTVTNACGCKDTFSLKITVRPTTGVNIICPGVVCEGAVDSYSLSPVVTCSSYLWSVVGGVFVGPLGPTVAVQWNHVDSSGFGYLSFNSGPCGLTCPGITTIKVPVITAHGHISGPKIVCDGGQYLFSMPQWPTTVFNWTITGTTASTLFANDQNNQIVLYAHGAGTVYLKCVYNNTLLGCAGIAYDTVTVVSPDSILGPAKVCYNSSTTYSLDGVASIIGDWTLTFPDGITVFTGTGHTFPTPVFSQVGTYTLTVLQDPASNPGFCPIDPFLIRVDTLPLPPDSLNGPDTVCYGTPITYYAANAIPGDVFEWSVNSGSLNFLDGNTTEAKFTGPGPDTIYVRRATKDIPHCYSNYISRAVYRPYVHPHITGADTVCPSSTSNYDAGYYEGETYTWNVLSPGMGSVRVNGLHTADVIWNNTSGPAQVVVSIRKCDSFYTDTFNVWVRIIPPTFPIALSAGTVCRLEDFTATAGVSGTVSWDWGDGTTSTGNPAIHYYPWLNPPTPYVYLITATALDPYGCNIPVTATTTITRLPNPEIYISPMGPIHFCNGTTPIATLTTTIESMWEPGDSLFWYFDGSIIGSCGPPIPCATETYTNVGTYYAIVKGVNGCWSAPSNVVTIDTIPCGGGMPCVLTPEPTVNILRTGTCGPVHLTGVVSGPPPTFVGSSWLYPPEALGVTTTSTTLDCHFDSAGSYDFTYEASFFDGTNTCTRSASMSVLVPLVPYMHYTEACAPGSTGYNITMYDNSSYLAGHEPYQYNWYKNGVYQGSSTTGSFTVFLLPGTTYTIGESVLYGPGATDSCTVSTVVTTPMLPVASFTFARDTTCAYQASVQFTNTTVGATSALWNFGDGPTNSEMNPYHIYAAPLFGGGYTVMLTITDALGCSASTTGFVPIIDTNLDGIILGDTVACAGSVVPLTYSSTPLSLPNPEIFLWMNGIDTMYYSLIGTTNVYTSGSYWLYGTNHYGCYVNTPKHNVSFIRIPPAIIDGDKSQCMGSPYTLNGWAGDGPGITYQWLKNGIPAGTGDTYTDPAAAPGTFVYQLIVSVPIPPAGFCSDTSAPDTVVVHPLPPPPGISYTMLDCNTYTLQLAASGPSSGWYNWSSSQTGQIVDVMGGGPYRVWYTDTFGCINHGDVFVPKDPRLYLWVFPTGCYGPYCLDDTTRNIIGPIQRFAYWAYQNAPLGPVLLDGFGTPVGRLHLSASGTYDMVLDNGLCRDTSGTMDVTFKPCSGCDARQFGLYEYSTPCSPVIPMDSCCNMFIVLNFPNSHPYPLFATVSITDGSLIPGGLLLHPGGNVDTFQFIPGIGFTGGWEYFTITYTDKEGATHECKDSVYIPACNMVNASGSKPGHQTVSSVKQIEGDVSMKLAPNPAQNMVRIDYVTDAAGATIELYDMTGRLMNNYVTPDNRGNWQLPLDNYSGGFYIVVLKENGRVILQGKLSIIR